MKGISSRLGYSRINTTIDIYTYSLHSADRVASSKIESLITSIEQTKECNNVTLFCLLKVLHICLLLSVQIFLILIHFYTIKNTIMK